MTVKVIPNSDLYRANFDKVFKGHAPHASDVNRGTIGRRADSAGSSAPRGATILDCFPDRVFMTSPLPASWGMVDGRPF
jgi:hypothetical protein